MNGIDLSNIKTKPTAKKQTPIDIYLQSAEDGNPMKFSITPTSDLIGYIESVDEYNILLSDNYNNKTLLYKSSFFKAEVETINSEFTELKPSTTKIRPNQQLSEWMNNNTKLKFVFKKEELIYGTIYNITTFEIIIYEEITNKLIILPKQNINYIKEI
jgi:sRNA-binding regulator protein Hfq